MSLGNKPKESEMDLLQLYSATQKLFNCQPAIAVLSASDCFNCLNPSQINTDTNEPVVKVWKWMARVNELLGSSILQIRIKAILLTQWI